MKTILVILSFFFLNVLNAQHSPEEFDVSILAKKLTDNEATELGKVSSIFKWITANISYKTRSATNNAVIGSASFKNYNEAGDDGPLKSVNERVSQQVLRKKEAVCDGYTRLFKTLCDYAGIHAEIIVGYADGGVGSRRFTVNHNWNAVQIDGKWHLLDPTWASGYLSIGGDEFVRRYEPLYFLTPPHIFIKDHYPDDARWTLIDDSRIPEEFKKSPFRQKSFVKYGIQSFYPSKGIIETFVGDTIRLRLETASADQHSNICPDLLADSAIYSHSASWVFLRPDAGAKANEYRYTYNVTSPNVEWLYLVYNDDVVLRYKVNVLGVRAN